MRPVPQTKLAMLSAPATGIVLIVFAGACNSPAEPTRAHLDIVAATTVAPGETARVQAFLVSSVGSRTDVTPRTTWSSSNTRVLSVANDGALTGGEVGDAMLRGTYRNVSATKEVIVVPHRTFRVSGTVSSSFSNLAIGVTVQLISADGNVRTATTDRDGYRFYGVAGHVQLRAWTSLHHVHQAEIDVADHVTHNVTLLPINLSGTYSLSISASSSCRSVLPEAVRTRHYGAIIAQEDSHGLLNVTLEGANFGGTPRFGGVISGSDGVFFRIPGGVGLDPWLGERIGEIWFVVYGEMRGTISADRLAGTLNGGMYVESWESGQKTVVECKAADHEMVFWR